MSADLPTADEATPGDGPPPAAPKRSGTEVIKENSQALRGNIAEELLQEAPKFSEQNKQLLKFHGTYQQEDRDARKDRRADGLGKYHMFMVRCKIPGGRVSADQYMGLDDLAGKHANSALRFTTRQGVQFHGVLKGDLKATIAGINATLLTTLGACGDVDRNVMACPAPHRHDGVHEELQATAARLAAHLAPRTRAYHEIWLNGSLQGDRGQGSGVSNPPTPDPSLLAPEVEPMYGKVYLPRKFKTGLATLEDNCIDIYAQDLGLLAVVEYGKIVGYNVLVGGGMGMTHGNAATFPHLAQPICYVPAGDVVHADESVVKLFRDHGNRADRRRARIKYVVHDWGVERFREVLAGYLGGTPALPRPVEAGGVNLHLGWHPQGDGKWYYGLSVENGRLKDEGALRLRTALRTIVERFHPELRLTPNQDVLLCNLASGDLPDLERLLAEDGVPRPEERTNVRKLSMACPAIPTCGLAISEAERSLPGILDELEVEMKKLGLEDEPFSVRMTGCPNGCARPYQSDVGIVGRSGDKYVLYVGGHVRGHRLNFELKDLVPRRDIVRFIRALLAYFKEERRPGESFGDYCQRIGQERCQALLRDYQI